MSDEQSEGKAWGRSKGRFTSDYQPRRTAEAHGDYDYRKDANSLRRLAEEHEEFEAWSVRTGSHDWIEFGKWKAAMRSPEKP